MTTPLDRAKAAILGDIRKALPGTGEVVISVEAHGGVEYFRQSLESVEVKQALVAKKLTARLRIINPLGIVEEQILDKIKCVNTGADIVFQTSYENSDLYYSAFELPEIKAEIERKNLRIGIQIIGKPRLPDIVIATVDDIAGGKLDEYLHYH